MFLFWKHIKDFNIHFLGFLAHNAVVTQSVFAPNPQLVFDQLEQNSGDLLNHQQQQPPDDSRSETKFNASSGNTSFKKDKSKDANKTNPGPGNIFSKKFFSKKGGRERLLIHFPSN